jgi:bifunctional enzyme CysN/CysC
MDRVARDEDAFRVLETSVRTFLATVGVHPLAVIPVVAKDGENVVTRAASTSWFMGPTVLDALLSLKAPVPAVDQPLRLVVQDVYRFDERRIVAGRVEAGTLRVGDRVRFHPGAKIGTVKSIERWGSKTAPTIVNAGDVFGITLVEPIFVERGQVAVLESGGNLSVSRRLRARVFWMGRRPLELDKPLKLRICTREESVRIVAIERALDAGTLGVGTDVAPIDRARSVKTNEVADVIIEARGPLAFDRASDVVATGRFVLVDGRDVAGGGLVLDALEDAAEDAQVLREVADEERHARFGHRGAVVSVADNARAVALERALFDRGLTVARANDAIGARALAAAGIVAVAQGVELDDAIRLSTAGTLAEQVEHVVEATSTKGTRHAA